MYISNRRTLSDSISQWLNFASYEEIKDKIIDTDVYNRLVIQIDSLHRIKDLSSVDLIIYDEFCSTLSHLCSVGERSTQKQINFINSFNHWCTWIILDGFLSDSDI